MIRFTSLLFWATLAIVASIGLYNTSYRVHDLSQQLHTINASIESEQRNIHVLKAEWVYLTNPTKIEQAAKKHLALRETSLQQVARMDSLSEALPNRGTVVAAQAHPTGAPVVLPAPVAMAAVAPANDTDHQHVNTRMVFQRASAPLASASGSMILARLGSRP